MSFDQSSVSIAAILSIDSDGLSYDEYFNRVEQMVQSMKLHWAQDQKVKALKSAIRLAKSLADTNQLKLYSKKYKIISDALDEFGMLIFTRIESISNGSIDISTIEPLMSQSSSDRESNSNNCHELAKDTCRNWFLKVASIRELVPRFYTELAILRTCDILLSSIQYGLSREQFYAQSLGRLTKTAFGFGNPIVAIHARAYLCKIATKLISWKTESSGDILYNVILTNIKSSTMIINNLDPQAISKIVGSDINIFFDLVSNGLQMMLDMLAYDYDQYEDQIETTRKSSERLRAILDILLEKARSENSSMFSRCAMIYSMLRSIPADIAADYCEEIISIIQAACKQCLDMPFGFQNSAIATSILYSTINSYTQALDSSETLERKFDLRARRVFLDSMSQMLEVLVEHDTKRNNPIGANYLNCFKTLLSYANNYVTQEDVDRLLSIFVQRIKESRQGVNQYSIILELIKRLVSNRKSVDDFESLVSLKSFARLLDLLRRDDHRLESSNWILENMRANLKLNNRSGFEIETKQMIDFILRLLATINDSLSPLVVDEDIDHMSELVIYFLERVKVNNFEEYLNLLSHCRGISGNMNLVLEYLIGKVLNLALEHNKIERKRSQKRNFLNGCLAYAFITIPALTEPLTRFKLLIRGTDLALCQVSLSLADSYLKQTLSCLNDILFPQPNLSHDQEESQYTMSNRNIHHNLRPDNKGLVAQIDLLLNLILKHEDHIDLKHKLVLTNIIKNSYQENAKLTESIKRLRVLDDGGGLTSSP